MRLSMKSIGMAFISLASVILVSSNSFAKAQGGRDGGGGNVVVCEGKPALVLDYYNAILPTGSGKIPNLVNIDGLTEEQTVAFFLDQLGPYLGARNTLEDTLKLIGPIDTWTAAKLKDFDDAQEPYDLPEGCVRKTGAFRQNPADFASPPEMFVDPRILPLLSPSQRGVLRMHEALYYSVALDLSRYSDGDPSTATPIGARRLIRELLMQDRDFDKISKLANEVGIDWENSPTFSWGVSKRFSGEYSVFKDFENAGNNPNSKSKVSVAIDPSTYLVTIANSSIDSLPNTLTFDCSYKALADSLRSHQASGMDDPNRYLECKSKSTDPVGKKDRLILNVFFKSSGEKYRDYLGFTFKRGEKSSWDFVEPIKDK